jgi:hypothetical protein
MERNPIHIFESVTNTHHDIPFDEYIAWARQDGWGAPLQGVENPFFVSRESIPALEEELPSVKEFTDEMARLRMEHSFEKGSTKHITSRAIYQHMVDNPFEQKIVAGNVATENAILMFQHWEEENTKGYSDIASDFLPQFRDEYMTKPAR